MAEPDSFENVMATYGRLIDHIAESYEAVPAIRQELVQEIALAVWRALPGLRDNRSMRGFIARIAHNRSVSHVAREARRPRGDAVAAEQPDEHSAPEAQIGRAMSRERLLRAIRSLPLSQRQVVTLVLEDMSHDEIADVLGISANSSMIRLSRARASLQKLLGDPS